MADFPPVPLTLEGSFLLHQFFRFDWKAWRSCADGERKKIAAAAVAALSRLERREARRTHPDRALLPTWPQGRPGSDPLPRLARSPQSGRTRSRADRAVRLSGVCATPMSRSSNSASTNPRARPTKPPPTKGLAELTRSGPPKSTPRSPAHSAAMAPRLFPAVPEAKYLCFYPMDRKRGETGQLVHRALRRTPAHDARARPDRPPLRRSWSSRSSPGQLDSMIGSGA